MKRTYTVYHIPELEKVGCTHRWPQRAIDQGFKADPWRVKLVTTDIDEASDYEATLRKEFGYKEDSDQTYSEKFNNKKQYKMNKRPTRSKIHLDSHFVGLNEIPKESATKATLRSFLDLEDTIELGTKDGAYIFGRDQYELLVDHAQTSQYKDFYWNSKVLKNIQAEVKPTVSKKLKVTDDYYQFDLIREWAEDKGIYAEGDAKTQYIKLQEEAGELAKALLNNDEAEIIDGIGDCVVVLTNLSNLLGFRIEDCIAAAYEDIKDRKGDMENGTFKKVG